MEDSLDGLILPQWLYTFIWQTGQYSFLLLSATTGIRIMQTFLRQKSTHPVLFKVGTALMALSYGFVFVVFIAQNYLSPVTRLAVINSIKTIRDILIFVNLGWVLLSLIAKMIQKSRVVYYYAITYAFFFVSCVMFMLNHLGLASINLVEPNILAWGLFFELLTLSVLLTGRFRYVIRQSGQLQVKNIQLEKRQVQELLEAQEYERKRIAEDLHDDIGATLSALQLHLSNLPADDPVILPTQKDYVGKALYLAAKAAEDVRNISHDLLPRDFRDLGLFRVLNNRIEELNSIQEIRFDLIVTGEETRLTDVQNITIYRIINELISNVIKHSQAAAATIQVLIHDLEAMLLVEDDGIGISAAADRKGIGLRNIQSRVSFLAARINIDSNSKGTNIIITIPLT
jgi:signal transduction histidine kinase